MIIMGCKSDITTETFFKQIKKNKSYLLIFASEINEFHYRTEWSNEVLIPLKISGISIIYPTGLDKYT
jgi:hypothetical protein